MDKASAYGAEDWGFESLRICYFLHAPLESVPVKLNLLAPIGSVHLNFWKQKRMPNFLKISYFANLIPPSEPHGVLGFWGFGVRF